MGEKGNVLEDVEVFCVGVQRPEDPTANQEALGLQRSTWANAKQELSVKERSAGD
jgi:hypothetical protein